MPDVDTIIITTPRELVASRNLIRKYFSGRIITMADIILDYQNNDIE